MNQNLESLCNYMKFFDGEISIKHEQVVLFLNNRQDLKNCLMSLKNSEFSFDQLISICGVDYLHHNDRFNVVYQLLSVRKNLRIRVKIAVSDGQYVDSITDVFRCANWYEREVWDMYGIVFTNHPDLRRIMTDYNFYGHPLRKDFPLTGHVEVRYDTICKKVVYEDVSLMQEYRSFDFQSPWNDKVLPGDEKAEI